MEGTGRRGRRRKQLLDDLKETRGCWKLNKEALDRTLGGGGNWLSKILWTCGERDSGLNEQNAY